MVPRSDLASGIPKSSLASSTEAGAGFPRSNMYSLKLKSASVVGLDMETRGEGVVWSCCTGLKEFIGQWAVSSLGSLGSLSSKDAGAVSPSVEIRGRGAVCNILYF